MSEPEFVPTPDEIAAECAAIRETWDEHRWAKEDGNRAAWEARIVKRPVDELWIDCGDDVQFKYGE